MFQFGVIVDVLPDLIRGLDVTLFVTAMSLTFSLLLGLLIGMMRLSKNKFVYSAATSYVAVLRNTPVLVQLIWVYYCLPLFLGVNIEATTSCIVALTLHGGAYVSEIVRGAIQSIDPGQTEAAMCIGLTYPQRMAKVILPQAFRRMIPPLANEGVTLLKYSSLVSTLGVADLTYNAQLVATQTFRPLEIYTFLAFQYLVLCLALSYLTYRLELRLANSG
jgi:amine acid ABC transporter, permease protein, 3-TM region, His/Glu/Gln/Arg/opine family